VTIYEAVRTAVMGVCSTVGDRVRPDQLAAGDDLPAIVMTVGANVPDAGLDGIFADRYTVSVTVYSETRAEADELADELRALDMEDLDDGSAAWSFFVESETRGALLVDSESSEPTYFVTITFTVLKC